MNKKYWCGFKSSPSTHPSRHSLLTSPNSIHSFNQLKSVSEVGRENFIKGKSTLPEATNIVNAGGFDNLYKLAADPKAELVQMIVDNSRKTGWNGKLEDNGKIDTLVALLQSKGEGFCSVKVDGEWEEVLSRQGKQSTKSQKFVSGKKKASLPTSTFNVKNMGFENTVLTRRGNGVLKADVKVSGIYRRPLIAKIWNA